MLSVFFMPEMCHNLNIFRNFAYANENDNFTNIGNKESLTVHNTKWLVRTFFGLRLGK